MMITIVSHGLMVELIKFCEVKVTGSGILLCLTPGVVCVCLYNDIRTLSITFFGKFISFINLRLLEFHQLYFNR